ncbi:MAG: ATP-binding protein [Oligoflexus sp.]
MGSIRFRLFMWISLAFTTCWALLNLNLAHVHHEARQAEIFKRMQESLQMVSASPLQGLPTQATDPAEQIFVSKQQNWLWLMASQYLPSFVERHLIVQTAQAQFTVKARSQPGSLQSGELSEPLLQEFVKTWLESDHAGRNRHWRGMVWEGVERVEYRLLASRQETRLENGVVSVVWVYKFRQEALHSWLWLEYFESFALLLAGGLIALILVAFFVANYLAFPLRQLASMACRIGDGDLQVEVPIKRRSDEIGLLATAMKVMAESLKNSYEQLAQHSQSLERTVHSQTKMLEQEKSYLNSVLHSIQDGLLVVDSNLMIMPGVSQTAFDILEQDELVGMNLIDRLYFYDQEHEQDAKLLHDTLMTAFHLFIPEQFSSMMSNLPRYWKINFKNEAKLLEFSFSPIIEKGSIQTIIITFQDETERQAVKHVGQYAHHKAVSFIEQLQDLSQNQRLRIALYEFLKDGFTTISEIQEILMAEAEFDCHQILRGLHTVKGNARSLRLDSIAFLAHEAENLLQKFRDERDSFNDYDYEELKSHIKYLLRGITSAQFILRTNLDDEESFAARWLAYTESTAEGLYDCARDLDKDLKIDWSINADMGSEDFSILKRVLVHMLRNAIDHGIETTTQRQAANKTLVGQISVSVEAEAGAWKVLVRDDGRGIDVAKLRERALEHGVPVAEEPWSTHDILQVLCHPGFSSKDEVTQVSGRGVGMDVVAQEIALIRGELELLHTSTQGTTFRLMWKQQQLSLDRGEPNDERRALSA